MAVVNSLTLVSTLISLSVVAAEETSPPEPPTCPIGGQIYYPECAPCDGTCKNPDPVCTLECKPGCACPAGQVIKHDRRCVNKTECSPAAVCPIKGQIYYPECAPCNGTCENPNPVCPLVCKPGCACPVGEVVKNGTKCVNETDCPRECPITGQIYYPECAPCEKTCENIFRRCDYKKCKPGCACPGHKVLKNGKRCVRRSRCYKK